MFRPSQPGDWASDDDDEDNVFNNPVVLTPAAPAPPISTNPPAINPWTKNTPTSTSTNTTNLSNEPTPSEAATVKKTAAPSKNWKVDNKWKDKKQQNSPRNNKRLDSSNSSKWKPPKDDLKSDGPRANAAWRRRAEQVSNYDENTKKQPYEDKKELQYGFVSTVKDRFGFITPVKQRSASSSSDVFFHLSNAPSQISVRNEVSFIMNDARGKEAATNITILTPGTIQTSSVDTDVTISGIVTRVPRGGSSGMVKDSDSKKFYSFTASLNLHYDDVVSFNIATDLMNSRKSAVNIKLVKSAKEARKQLIENSPREVGVIRKNSVLVIGKRDDCHHGKTFRIVEPKELSRRVGTYKNRDNVSCVIIVEKDGEEVATDLKVLEYGSVPLVKTVASNVTGSITNLNTVKTSEDGQEYKFKSEEFFLVGDEVCVDVMQDVLTEKFKIRNLKLKTPTCENLEQGVVSVLKNGFGFITRATYDFDYPKVYFKTTDLLVRIGDHVKFNIITEDGKMRAVRITKLKSKITLEELVSPNLQGKIVEVKKSSFGKLEYVVEDPLLILKTVAPEITLSDEMSLEGLNSFQKKAVLKFVDASSKFKVEDNKLLEVMGEESDDMKKRVDLIDFADLKDAPRYVPSINDSVSFDLYVLKSSRKLVARNVVFKNRETFTGVITQVGKGFGFVFCIEKKDSFYFVNNDEYRKNDSVSFSIIKHDTKDNKTDNYRATGLTKLKEPLVVESKVEGSSFLGTCIEASTGTQQHYRRGKKKPSFAKILLQDDDENTEVIKKNNTTCVVLDSKISLSIGDIVKVTELYQSLIGQNKLIAKELMILEKGKRLTGVVESIDNKMGGVIKLTGDDENTIEFKASDVTGRNVHLKTGDKVELSVLNESIGKHIKLLTSESDENTSSTRVNSTLRKALQDASVTNMTGGGNMIRMAKGPDGTIGFNSLHFTGMDDCITTSPKASLDPSAKVFSPIMTPSENVVSEKSQFF